MPLAPPTGHVHAIRVRGVVDVPTKVIGGITYHGGKISPGYSAIITEGEAEASTAWLWVSELENIGSHDDDGSSFLGISGSAAYLDTEGATPGEDALLTVRNGLYFLDDLAIVE